MKHRLVFSIAALTILVGHAVAHQSRVVDEVDQKIRQHLEKTFPSWKYERVEPFMNAQDVLVQFWSFANRKVKISILPYQSVEEAQKAFKNNQRYGFNRAVLNGLGDEAISSGYGGSDVAFRRGKYNVFIRSTADFEAEPDSRNLTREQIFEREKSEIRRLSREFAKYVADALAAP